MLGYRSLGIQEVCTLGSLARSGSSGEVWQVRGKFGKFGRTGVVMPERVCNMSVNCTSVIRGYCWNAIDSIREMEKTSNGVIREITAVMGEITVMEVKITGAINECTSVKCLSGLRPVWTVLETGGALISECCAGHP
jgi:hypothetical protein